MAARNILRRAATIPVVGHAAEFLGDTLDWLHFWSWNNPNGTDEFSEDLHYPDHKNHISPRL